MNFVFALNKFTNFVTVYAATIVERFYIENWYGKRYLEKYNSKFDLYIYKSQ